MLFLSVCSRTIIMQVCLLLIPKKIQSLVSFDAIDFSNFYNFLIVIDFPLVHSATLLCQHVCQLFFIILCISRILMRFSKSQLPNKQKHKKVLRKVHNISKVAYQTMCVHRGAKIPIYNLRISYGRIPSNRPKNYKFNDYHIS